jgi:outer membrane murein-binding lipoprotein Lpp
MTAMNPHAAITRNEFERTIEELRAEMKANPSHSTAADRASPEHPREEFVRKDEFRLFKWSAGLALAAILSGMGLLYQAIAEQRVAMERQFADLRAEMHAGFRAITASMDSRFDGVNSSFSSVNSRFDQMDSRFDQMDSRITAVQHDVADVKERLARVETLVGVKNRESLPD